MQNNRLLFKFILIFVFMIGLLNAATPAKAATSEKVLVSLGSNSTDGYYPYSGLVFDDSGNLYGTTFDGGVNGLGAVIELMPAAGGTWTETLLYSFCSTTNCVDGTNPEGGLILDTAGNLYGTAESGGGHGAGVVFELERGSNGKWKEKVLHNFNTVGTDGYYPLSSLVFDASGNLYGTTEWGGAYNSGTVFRLKPGTNHKWTEKILHSFSDNGTDGSAPYAALVFDKAGNLYGTTTAGGTSRTGCGGQGCGIVFELKHASGGEWVETILYSFLANGKDGYKPWGGVILDAAGNVYGTTNLGGPANGGCSSGCGIVFKLAPTAKGKWTETVLHAFKKNNQDGYLSAAGLTLDKDGNLYGTTFYGGGFDDGTVFAMVKADKKWTEKVIHDFDWSLTVKDGTSPSSGLIPDAAGNLYGTTVDGGLYNFGAVYEITP